MILLRIDSSNKRQAGDIKQNKIYLLSKDNHKTSRKSIKLKKAVVNSIFSKP